jgi:cobyrinic acid a,c-diamide synthase
MADVRGEQARVVLAGLAGDTGKSLVSLGVIGALRRRGIAVAPFKKGPDFIDAAWLGRAAAAPGRNLDTFMMPAAAILRSLGAGSRGAGIAVVEGNRGLFDGLDAQGSHSTAQLAKLIDAPVVLVVDVTKTTRTVAAQVLGCQVLDRELRLAGVILNRVGTRRQEKVIREAITAATGLPVLGAVPRLHGEQLPSRHLGLVTSVEHPRAGEVLEYVAEMVAAHVDIEALLAVGRGAGDLEIPAAAAVAPPARRVRIGVLQDRAFSFYYPENLTALEEAGAELRSISPLADEALPAIDGLYAGGGFPEVYAAGLSQNRALREALGRRVAAGLPVWAECGGLMYLAEELITADATYPMVGALPIVVEQMSRPQGHGYVRARTDRANPFLDEGTDLCGHEFHYSRLRDDGSRVATVLELARGVGVGHGRDGIQVGNVVAAYTHLHARGAPAWAPGLVRAAAGSVQ